MDASLVHGRPMTLPVRPLSRAASWRAETEPALCRAENPVPAEANSLAEPAVSVSAFEICEAGFASGATASAGAVTAPAVSLTEPASCVTAEASAVTAHVAQSLKPRVQ